MNKPNPIGIALGLAAAVTFTAFVGKQSWGLIKEGLKDLPRKTKELTGIVIGTTIALIPIIILRNILKP